MCYYCSMEREPIFEGQVEPEPVEKIEDGETPSEQLRLLVESLGFVESAEMVEIKGELVAEWSVEAESRYHLAGESIATEASGATGQISLILQMAMVQIEAGQIELATENLADALEYADNMGDEELGDQIHAIKKILTAKSVIDEK